MGSSLILKGGASTPKTVLETISRANSFVSGDVVRYDPSVGAAGTWYRSQANSAENAEVVGVVQNASATSFDVVYSGFISLSGYAGVSAPVLFLSAEVPGGLTSSPPSALGTVVKPVLTRTTTGGGYVVTNYLGTQIGGSSTISVDEIQPVGTIMPFAGSVIPDTWLACDGASYDISTYPQLYAKLQNSSGDRVPAYGYVATLTGPGANSSNFAPGDMIQFKITAGAFTGGLYDSNADIIGIITSISTSGTVTASGTITVQVLPNYNSTTKKFQFPTTVFTSGTGTPTSTGSGNYRVLTTPASTSNSGNGVWRGGSANLTVTTSIAITHFNTPDLRGRFAIGSNATARGEIDGDLTGDTHYSAISGGYSMGVQGGQEFVVATPVSINSAATGTAVNVINNIGSSSNIANMPPYTVVRYIIKASPYTRAAIIDDIDIPYSNLLIRDLRTRLLGGSNSDLVFHTNTSGDSGLGTERMRLSTAGYLGIGTNGPSAPLSVCNPSGGGLEIVPSSGGDFVVTQTFNRATGQYIENAFRGSFLSFYTGQITAERLRIDANGNVGIGSSSPASTLHIRSAAPIIRLEDTDDSGAYSQINCNSSGGQAGSLILEADKGANNANSFMRFDLQGTERVRITASGAVGIGTSTPGRNLAIVATAPVLQLAATSGYSAVRGLLFSIESNNAQMWNYEAGYLRFGTNNTQRMIISSDGDVGVGGSASTAYKFSVTGKIYASDDIVAFSDARYKRDISPIADSLNKVRSLVGVLYTDSNGSRKTGLLAQDVQAVLPEAVSTDEAGNLALAYGNLVGLLVEAVKELTTRVHELETR